MPINTKKCSTLLTFREMQIKSTLRALVFSVRIKVIKKITNAGENMDKWETLYTLLVGMYSSLVTTAISIEGHHKIKSRFTTLPIYITLGIYPKNSKSTNHIDTCTLMFIGARFTMNKLGSQPRYPTQEFIEETLYIYTMECFQS